MSQDFLASEYTPAQENKAGFYIIPCPMEKSVSYGKGTVNGPAAILTASQELEAEEYGMAPGKAGIYTMPPINCEGPTEAVLLRIESAVEKALSPHALPGLFGGEHTVTLGALRTFALNAREKGEKFGVIQFDAHADLRDSYKDNRYSHATFMRRALEEMDIPLVQIAARDMSPEEIEIREQYGITHYDSYFLARVGLPEKPLPENFPTNIYITFDLDALDSSLMPATGTPSPGGINWRETQFILEACVRNHKIIGLDVCELAPIKGLHHADFTAAKLVHLLMGLAWESNSFIPASKEASS